ncbi:hypothetical protein [Streptomyces sp. NPDC085479]|uniref:hypothetical protein n=1 Tax=Streptomyces sp. NPDC085479 TaxID=3365726 RepID=UPI0037D4D825
MSVSALAAAAVRLLTEGAPMRAEQQAAVRELVWGRLGRSALGASALSRFHEQPSEGSAAIVASVLADEMRADQDFADLMTRVMRLPPAPPVRAPGAESGTQGPVTPPAAPPPPPVAPAPGRPDPAVVREVWLLGLPQAILAYILLSVVGANELGMFLAVAILLMSSGLAAFGVWLGVDLLRRRIRGHLLEAGIVLNVLVLTRLVLWMVQL